MINILVLKIQIMSHIQRSLDIFGFLCVITNIDDVRRKRRYGRNILQWSKNDFKSRINTNGDYCFFAHQLFASCFKFFQVRVPLATSVRNLSSAIRNSRKKLFKNYATQILSQIDSYLPLLRKNGSFTHTLIYRRFLCRYRISLL